MNELTIGSVIRDTYRLERHIGAGAMGTVYAASHVRSAERFAIKVLRGLAVNNPRAVARFEQEASAISSIAHPHLVEVFEYGRSKAGVPYIVMELLEGHDLARRLDQRGRFAPREAVSLLVQTAAALQAVHEAGIVHRDLKPTNIFLCRRGDRDDFVKLLDFGISKVLGSAVDETGTNQVLGTPRFMSPEQATGKAASVDQRSDVFSLAAIGFEVLSGEPAFLGEGAMQSMYRVVNHEPPPLDEIAPVAKSLARVIARALSKEPRARPGSAEQLARELMHAMKLAPSDDDELAWLETSDIRRTMAWTTSGMTTDPLGDGATLVALSDVTADTTLPPVTAVAIDHASGDPPVGERVTTELVPVPSAPPAVLHGAPTLSLDPARDDGDRAGVKAHVQPKAAPVIPAPPAQPAIPAPPPTRALNVKLLALAAALLLFAVSLLLVLLLDRPADVTRKRAGAAAQARRVDGAPALADALPVDSASA
ncbi:MAG: serine/threonine protein kinase, partial [Myxococcales bacterium]|nr:serine/threonine protein kinase [Myxococcales bacterium]